MFMSRLCVVIQREREREEGEEVDSYLICVHNVCFFTHYFGICGLLPVAIHLFIKIKIDFSQKFFLSVC